MSRLIFIFLLFLAAVLRGPISFLLAIFKFFSAPLKKRIDFERLNLIQNECKSFKRDCSSADYCFEVSSEGELEQVRPLIEYYLSKEKRIEILFSSPSVEIKCLDLARRSKNQIRIMRLPLASFFPVSFLFFQSPWSFITAPTIIFCRYDFFPELLSLKFFGKKLILLSGAYKKPSWFKNQCYSLFNLLVASNEKEATSFKNQFPDIKVFNFDFRIPRIFKRINKASSRLKDVPELATYLEYLELLPPNKKFIMGSAWESDITILNNDVLMKEMALGSIHLLLVPHKLNKNSIVELKKYLLSIMPLTPIYEIKKSEEFNASILIRKPGIVLLNMSGILCELYSYFSFSYVGGGYERSIHSVLEPFLSGCQVIVGPKVSRSTEYDFIKELAPMEIHLLNTPESFYHLLNEFISKTPKQGIRNDLLKKANAVMESIIKEIESC